MALIEPSMCGAQQARSTCCRVSLLGLSVTTIVAEHNYCFEDIFFSVVRICCRDAGSWCTQGVRP